MPCSSRFSSAAETHSASIITTIAVRPPSISARSVSRVVPAPMLMRSSSASSSGSRPVIHSAAAAQAPQDTVRSMRVAHAEVGKAARSTRTDRRIAASDTSSGTAMWNTVTGSHTCQSRRALKASASARAGKSTPSKSRSPNQIESGRGSLPRSSRTTSAASTRQPISAPSSSKAVGCSRWWRKRARSAEVMACVMPPAARRGGRKGGSRSAP